VDHVAIVRDDGRPVKTHREEDTEPLPADEWVEVPTDLPACTALRGQPCRDYVPYVNVPADG